jgi:hypothetical protein
MSGLREGCKETLERLYYYSYGAVKENKEPF